MFGFCAFSQSFLDSAPGLNEKGNMLTVVFFIPFHFVTTNIFQCCRFVAKSKIYISSEPTFRLQKLSHKRGEHHEALYFVKYTCKGRPRYPFDRDFCPFEIVDQLKLVRILLFVEKLKIRGRWLFDERKTLWWMCGNSDGFLSHVRFCMDNSPVIFCYRC